MRSIRDVSAIKANRFALIKAGKGFVRRNRVFEIRSAVHDRPRRERQATNEIFVQLSIDAEPYTNARPIAIIANGTAARISLDETLAADADVSGEAEAPGEAFC